MDSGNIYTRLHKVVEYSDLSQNKFALKVGIDRGLVSKMLNGTKFGIDKLMQIINSFPEISMEWLLRGKGEMILRPEDSLQQSETIETYKQTINELKEENTWLKGHAKDLALILKTQNNPETDTSKSVKKGRRQKNIV